MKEKEKHLTTPEILAWWNSKKDAKFNTSHYLKVVAAKALMINNGDDLKLVISINT